MMRITRWKPDTCACVIDLAFDDEEPEESRTHTSTLVTSCAVHTVPEDVVEENTTKNRAVGAILADDPTRKPEDIAWAFDPDRKVKIAVPDLSPEALQVVLDGQLGPGKVIASDVTDIKKAPRG